MGVRLSPLAHKFCVSKICPDTRTRYTEIHIMTNTQIENLGKTKKRVTIKVPKEDVDSYLKKACQRVNGKAKINGFRPGKIPQNILDRHYGADIDVECLNTMVDETFPKALESHSLFPVTKPDFHIEPLVRNVAYHYSVDVEVKPEFELKPYRDINLKKHALKVEENEMQKELEAIQENLAELKPAEGKDTLEAGLVGIIDFEGRIDGKVFEGGKAENYTLHYGKGNFLKDFEEQMSGMKVGEERLIKITFPQDYFQKDLAGKDAEFTVKLNALNEKVRSPIDDDLARDVGKKDLAELKAEIEKFLLEGKKNAVRQDQVAEIREILLKDYADLEVPHGLIHEEMEKSKTPHDEIEKNLRFEFVLEAIARAEKMEAKPEDVDARLSLYAQLYRKPLNEVRSIFLTQRMFPYLVNGILVDKALDFIIEHARM